MKRLKLVKEVDGKRHVYSTYRTSILDGNKEILIVTNKKKGTQDLYEVFYTYSQVERRFLSEVCIQATNKEVIRILQENFNMVI